MKRLPLITIIFILVISIFLFLMQEKRPEKVAANVIQAAFATTGAKVVTSEIYMRGKLGAQDCDSSQERRLLLSAVIRTAGADTDACKPVFSEINTDSSNGTQLDYIINNDLRIQAGILNEKQGSFTRESLVTISLTNTSQKQELSEAVASLESVLKKHCTSISENICMTGSFDGTLDNGEVAAVCDKILKSTGADKVEGLQEKELVSVSAFSPSIGDYVRVNGKRINLNVAVRYNSYEGKTYIWLASPVITTEY